jgi:N6-L-threonylcarbamoyladenine synthase
MIILGIETSCDETAAAVVSSNRTIKAQHLRSQLTEHSPFGGVVPEIAARAHLDSLQGIIAQVMESAALEFYQLDGVAAAGGPGLIGGVIAGVMMAKAISAAHNIPFLAVNHLAAHALTIRLTHGVEFPFLLLLVSGGHCQLIIVHEADDFQVLGGTIDDAVGEAFDKTARLLANIYPGGPFIEQQAARGDPSRFTLPRPLIHQKDPASQFSFSFSGLKTAVRQLVSGVTFEGDRDIPDICAAFQSSVGDILLNRCNNALAFCRAAGVPLSCLAVAGGVAANQYLRQRLMVLAQRYELDLLAPPVPLCTDNAAMIAWAGVEKLRLGQVDTLDFSPRPRWPLERRAQ